MTHTRNSERSEKACATADKRSGQTGRLLIGVVAALILTIDVLSVICAI